MKAKISRGGGFRGALDYVFDRGPKATNDKQPELVAGNMVGKDPRDLTQEFAAVRLLRPDISKPVWHCSLALPQGERLEAGKWAEVAGDFMEAMDFDRGTTPWVAVRHQDTAQDHIHIVASRVGVDSKVWLGRWEARRAIEATQRLEQTHGLTVTAGLGRAKAQKRSLTANEINQAVRTGKEPPRQKLQRIVAEAAKYRPTSVEFAERLEAAGVSVRANIANTGRMNGFSFEIDGIAIKGSGLGKGFTWKGLQNRGVSYEQTRDSQKLERFRTPVTDRQVGARSGRGNNSIKNDHGESSRRDGRENERVLGATERGKSRSDQDHGPDRTKRGPDQSRRRQPDSRERPTHAPGAAVAPRKKNAGADLGRGDRGNVGPDGASSVRSAADVAGDQRPAPANGRGRTVAKMESDVEQSHSKGAETHGGDLPKEAQILTKQEDKVRAELSGTLITMAMKRQGRWFGWYDSSENWQATPEELRQAVDRLSKQPKNKREELVKEILNDPKTVKRIGALVEQRETKIHKMDRGAIR